MTKKAYSVPYTAIHLQAAQIQQELVEAFQAVLNSGQYVLGKRVLQFEEEFAAYCQTKYAVGIASGTCALHLVLRALGLKEGDEVITVPNSFIATASCIALVGARPVFVDIRSNLNMDPGQIEAAITPRTKAVIPVHLTGRPAPMVEILEIARRHGLFVIEDAAQAVGARINGRAVGSWGDAACFSFHPLKNLHAFGDGGMITTNEQGLYNRLLKARNHGLENRDQCDFWGFNCRLDEIHAAMLSVQLKYIDRWTAVRRRLAFRYNDLLRTYVDVPEEASGEFCVYQTYMVQAPRRDELQNYLMEKGIQALVHYPIPIHLQPAARSLGYSQGDFPVVMETATRILSLPLYPAVTAEQQEYVAASIAEFYGNIPRRC